jgi:uncharacterized membrane protein
MEEASKVMYKIANVFNWIELVLGVLMVVFGIVLIVNPSAIQSSNTVQEVAAGGTGLLIAGIWLIIIPIVLIFLTRAAYKKGSSQNWDIIFLIFGVIGGSIFYFLGGLFGILAKNK